MNTDTKTILIKTISRLGKASVTEVIKNLPERRSRQWISTLLNRMANNGELVRSKSGKFAFFVLPNRIDLIGKKVTKRLINKDLQEDIIFDELSRQSLFVKQVKEGVHSILGYAFTEMLNNAIEHSSSDTINVFFEEVNDNISFEVLDRGIGAFRNIMQKNKLSSELEAIQELLKGKMTTLPHSHTGEGIFFTSKIADIFILDSFNYRLRVDNIIHDVFVEKINPYVGTRVRFEIDKRSGKHLNDIFYEYQAEPGSHSFDKTKVHVKLYKAGTIYISRSQARRLIANLDKFKLIILDFEGIGTIGQAFADEVFRIFVAKHPHTAIQPTNMSETVEFMVNRVQPQLTLLDKEKTA